MDDAGRGSSTSVGTTDGRGPSTSVGTTKRREVNAIAGRLSLRPPQREALEILDRVTDLVPPKERIDLESALELIQGEYPSVTDFEREFPSLCFALATGVGKTRLMGAFISYLHEAHGIDNFFVLAPNLTIYNKLIADFTPGSPKYVFTGISAFATQAPEIITGDNYESRAGTLFDQLIRCKVNIFNISKINTEVRGGASPRIKRLSEYLGESYFDYLANLPDLVLLMDESHRYRASAGIRAINELKPILGLELTATPYVTSGTKTTPFRNVIYDYPLRKAMEDGFVKEPAVVTRKDFSPAGMQAAELERMKLEDGIRLHEQTKVQLETYARDHQQEIVKPFLLVIARDTTHAAELQTLIRSEGFFGGQYAEKVIQVDSSGSGAEKDETVERLLRVERPDEPTEIVIHVNMLKEGWDVTNLYTIVPLRAANARVLIEQSIGRGLRLPYGKRTGVAEVDRLSIVAHDKFQEIVDEASRPDSVISKFATIELGAGDLERQGKTVVAESVADKILDGSAIVAGRDAPLTQAEQAVGNAIWRLLSNEQRNPAEVPDVRYLQRPEVCARIVEETKATYLSGQLSLDGIDASVDIEQVVADLISVKVEGTISIPRITVLPAGPVRSWFEPFVVDFSSWQLRPSDQTILSQSLRTGEQLTFGIAPAAERARRVQDYILNGLVAFDDVSYDHNAAMLNDLADQTIAYLRTYLDESEIEPAVREHQRRIADLLHSQMQDHYFEEESPLDVKVSAGFSDILAPAYTQTRPSLNFRQPPPDKSKIASELFVGFRSCLHTPQKFQSDQERILSVILDREDGAQRWFRPQRNQFNIYYRLGSELPRYQPDFVAEFDDFIAMIEVKARNELGSAEVVAKRDAAVTWCERASEYTRSYDGGKPWIYSLIPHDEISENWTARNLVVAKTVSPAGTLLR